LRHQHGFCGNFISNVYRTDHFTEAPADRTGQFQFHDQGVAGNNFLFEFAVLHRHVKIFAVLIILLLIPLFLFIGIAILIEDGFPIFFIQKRIGVNYTFFRIWKFRSMKKNTPNVATHLLADPDQYLLKIGKFIRKTSLDELPNLINIIKGEMVFVGPRPALYNQDDLMALRVANGVDKLKPGITGWAQINGRDDLSIEKKVRLEQEYMNKRSTLFNIEIIIKTFTNVLFSKGVSH
jgi:O-antigen biosynthesis protein WbqP